MNLNFKNVEIENILKKEDVLKKVSEVDIFSFYLGKKAQLRTIYNSPFRDDKKPSFGFVISKEGEMFGRDFTTKKTYDIVRFVSELYNVSYKDAIKKICFDFNISVDNNKLLIDYERKINPFIYQKEKEKKETLIQIQPRDFTKKDLKYFGQVEITKEELINNDVFSWEKAWLNKEIIYDPEELRFAYYQKIPETGKECFKLYQPKANKMKWINNIPITVPFGIDKLNIVEPLVITKSQKDRILLKKFFVDVIATQNESKEAIEDYVEFIKNNYKRVIIIWDADNTGVKECQHLTKLYNWEYFNTPKYLFEFEKIKDPWDYVKNFGLKKFEKRLKEKKILI